MSRPGQLTPPVALNGVLFLLLPCDDLYQFDLEINGLIPGMHTAAAATNISLEAQPMAVTNNEMDCSE